MESTNMIIFIAIAHTDWRSGNGDIYTAIEKNTKQLDDANAEV